jgi:hypothetical protein
MTRDTIKPHDHPDFVGGWVWTKLEMRWIEEHIAKAIAAERESAAVMTEQLGMQGYGTLAIAAAIRKGQA